jgi:uncharacterized protein
MVHAPKAYLVDTGLLAHLLNANAARVRSDQRVTGMLLENFVGMEIVKQLGTSEGSARAHHFRDRDGYEVDVVLEDNAGEVVGVEVKATASVSPGDFRGLRKLESLAKENFRCGVLFYAGENTLRFGERLWAVPVSGLWQ